MVKIPHYRQKGWRRRPKEGVLVGIPAVDGYVYGKIALETQVSGVLSMLEDHPYYYDLQQVAYRRPVEAARNGLTARMEKDKRYTHFIFWDDDMAPPENWPELVGKGDIVSGITWMWRAGLPPLQRLQLNQFDFVDERTTKTLEAPRSLTEPYEVDAVGTAAMCIHRRVFERLGFSPFDTHQTPTGATQEGEDIRFCRKARAAGFKVTIVPTVVFEHVYQVGLRGVFEALVATRQHAVAETEARIKAELEEYAERARAQERPPEPALEVAVAEAASC